MIDQDVLERVLGRALRDGGDFAEVFAEDRRTSSARLDDGKIEELTSGRDRGAGIRVVRGETTGFAHTSDLTEEGLRAAAERVTAAVAGRAGDLELPLDVRASAFRLRVWRELRAIPRGETRSYTEVARAIGRPSAARAVASACAANPVAVIVPCHRVVAADGTLAGYRWGLDRKRALLRAERAERAERC